MFGYMWIEVAEREYTYLSMSGAYVSYANVFESIFWRMLWKSGIEEPRKFATEEDLRAVMVGYKAMEARPGAKECVQKLRDAGFTVWAFTMVRDRELMRRDGLADTGPGRPREGQRILQEVRH